jgi:hypothetical protein
VPNNLSLISWIWAGAGITLSIYVALFLVLRRPASLRPARLAVFVAAPLAARLALLPWQPILGTWDWLAIIIAGTSIQSFLIIFRTWLVREGEAPLTDQLSEACRRLFLDYTTPFLGTWVFSARGKTYRLQKTRLGGPFLLLRLPPVKSPGKPALLFDWLSKAYPGPVPRIRIVLTRSEPCPGQASK